MVEGDRINGLFDCEVFTTEQRRKYGRYIDSSTLKILFYDMLESYYRNVGLDSDVMITLQILKAGMRIQTDKTSLNARNINDFWPQTTKKTSSYRWHSELLKILSYIYEKSGDLSALDRHLQKKRNIFEE